MAPQNLNTSTRGKTRHKRELKIAEVPTGATTSKNSFTQRKIGKPSRKKKINMITIHRLHSQSGRVLEKGESLEVDMGTPSGGLRSQ